MQDDDDDDDDKVEHHQLLNATNTTVQRHYELLGAPCLLYRNYESYSLLDDDEQQEMNNNNNNSHRHHHHHHLARRRRVQARWYYPMDYHMIKITNQDDAHFGTTAEAGVNGDTRMRNKTRSTSRRKRDRKNDNDSDSGQSQDDDEEEEEEAEQRVDGYLNVTRKQQLAVLDDDDYLNEQSLGIQAEARLNLLLQQQGLLQQQSRAPQQHHDSSCGKVEPRVVVLNHQRYDVNYVPAKLRLLKWQVRQQQKSNDDDDESAGNEESSNNKSTTQQPTRTIKSRPVYGLTSAQTRKTRYCLLQRQAMADPAYMAPFGREALLEATARTSRSNNNNNNNESSKTTIAMIAAPTLDGLQASQEKKEKPIIHEPLFRKTPAIPTDDPHSPEEFGNCLVCFACTCPHCRRRCKDSSEDEDGISKSAISNATSWWILHPVGALQDCVRLSCILLPHGQTLAPVDMMMKKSSSSKMHSNLHNKELPIGDRIRQLVQCTIGPDKFVARTSNYCIVFEISVAPLTDPVQINNETTASCLGNLQILRQVYKIDLRSNIIARDTMPSFRPCHVASHPNYGNTAGAWIDPKLAILCEWDNRRERNVIQHVMVGRGGEDDDLRMTRHVITNLQYISTIEFTRHHPMLLWSAARSYVRPALAVGKFTRKPTFGHGTSLYSIDLRSNSATFQWSPSAEQVMTEGLQSISGIHTNHPYQETSIYVSSVSAGKTWEIDTRMPCEVVNTWSLPHACDDCDEITPVTGLHGAGTLLVHPLTQPAHTSVTTEENDTHNTLPRSVLAVGKSPGTFGIHLYQPPDRRPRFQTATVEVASTPAVVNGAMLPSFAVSSIFPLPDVSDKVFTCGLVAFRVPTTALLPNAVLEQLEPSRGCMDWTVCAITVTNKGDVYSHSLVESTATTTCASSRAHANLPVGCAAIALPMENPAKIAPSSFPGNEHLALRLSNEFPAPSGTVFLPAAPLDTQMVAKRKRKARKPKPIPKPPPKKSCPFHNVPTGKVKVRMVYPIVMSNDPTKTRKKVELPVSHLEEAGQLLSTAIDCFPPEAPPAYQEAPERSDLTMEVLEKAASSWGRQKTENPQTDYTIYNI